MKKKTCLITGATNGVGIRAFMHIGILIILSGIFPTISLYAQNEQPIYIFRAYEDNDLLNILYKATDRAYTAGQQVNLYYDLPYKPNFFLDKWLPKAGDSSANTYSVGLMQLMYTPQNLVTTYYSPNDYSYVGAFIGKKSLYSYNFKKKYDLQTELVFGLIGPATLTGISQSWLHSLLNDPVPIGWGNQYKNDILLNINFTSEKELYGTKGIELIANGQASVGTMYDGLEFGGTMYFGKMNPYFNGFMGHYSSLYKKRKKCSNEIQAYFILKLAVQGVAYNAMLQGGLFTRPPMVKALIGNGSENEVVYIDKPYQPIENIVEYGSCGIVIAYRDFCIAYTQTTSSTVLKNVYSDRYGNISVYYSW